MLARLHFVATLLLAAAVLWLGWSSLGERRMATWREESLRAQIASLEENGGAPALSGDSTPEQLVIQMGDQRRVIDLRKAGVHLSCADAAHAAKVKDVCLIPDAESVDCEITDPQHSFRTLI